MADTKQILRFQGGLQKSASGVVTPVFGSTPGTVAQGDDARLMVQNVLRVKKNPGAGEFSSIAAAVATISGSGPNNRFLIEVGPGVYDEPQINLPVWTSVRGASINSTLVRPAVFNQHVFVMAEMTELSFMSLQGIAGSLGSGYAAIWCEDVGNFAQFHKLSIYDFDIGIRNWARFAESTIYVEYVDINGDYSYAIWNTANTGFMNRMQAENFYTYESNSAIKTTILNEGANAEALLLAVGLIGSLTGGKGVVSRDGAYTVVTGSFIQDFGDAAIITENVGSAPTVDIYASDFKNCAVNIKLQHPTTAGHLIGEADRTKTQIPSTSTFFVIGQDAQVIIVAKRGGDFSSIKAAVDFITDASATKPYIVQVGPGVFVEQEIALKPYVSIAGSSTAGTEVRPVNSNQHVFKMANHSEVMFLSVRGLGTVGYAGFWCEDVDLGARIHKVIINDCDHGIRALANTKTNKLLVEHAEINGTYSYGARNTADNGFKGRVDATDLYLNPSPTNAGVGICSGGPDSEFYLVSSGILGVATEIAGARVRRSGYFGIRATYFENCARAIYSENTGPGTPEFDIEGVDFKDCTINIHIEQPTTSGHFTGYSPREKVIIPDTATFFVSNRDTQVVTVARRGGDYTSVKAAVDAITDASSSKPYTVSVGPGVFVEDTITMKPFVTVEGRGNGATVIMPNSPNKNAVVGVPASAIQGCMILGASGTGYAAVYSEGGAVDSPFVIKDCVFGSSYYGVHVKSVVNNVVVGLNGCWVGDATGMDSVLFSESAPGIRASIIASDFMLRDHASGGPAYFAKATGDSAFLRLSSIHAIKSSGTGTGVYIEDGGTLHLASAVFDGFDRGICSGNVGAAPKMDALGVDFDNITTWDVHVEHPGTEGHFVGSASSSKVFVDPSANINLLYSTVDPLDKYGHVMLGDIAQGQRHDKLFNFSDLVRKSSTLGLVSGGALSVGTGLAVDVAAGYGFVEDLTDFITEVTWAAQSVSLPANSANYIYATHAGVLSYSASRPNTHHNIILGWVVTNATGIEILGKTPFKSYHHGNETHSFCRDVLGAAFVSGSQVAETGTRNLQVSAGSYYFAEIKFAPAGGNPITFTAHNHDVLGDWVRTTGVTQVDNTSWDTGLGLQNLTAGYYTKHSLYLSGDGANEKYLFVWGQAEYSALAAVDTAPLPLPPSYFTESVVLIASIIVQQGQTNIIQIKQEHPKMGTTPGAVAASSDHGNLQGLADDDHLQYLLVNGGRAMSGALDMGGNAVSNAATVNGIVVQTHASRHLPNGADALATASAIGISDATNGVGTANSFARADHLHAHGDRGGGTLHALATQSVAGFMSAADKSTLDQLASITTAIKDPTGFENRADSTMSFNAGTRTFTIQPVGVSFSYWISGTKYTKTVAQSVVIADVDGLHYIYFNGATLVDDPTPPDMSFSRDVAAVAVLCWDVASQQLLYMGEERHGISMDWATHSYLHNTRGTMYESGLALGDFVAGGDGSIAQHAQFSVANGIIHDEDIDISITSGAPQVLSPTASIPICYKLGAGSGVWKRKAADAYPLIYSGSAGYIGANGRIPFNENHITNGWQLTEASEGYFVLVHYFATNDVSTPVFGFQGLTQYTTLESAREAAHGEIGLITGISIQEYAPIGTVIFQTSSAFGNVPKAAIMAYNGEPYRDLRGLRVFNPGATNDHGSLIGLTDDDHKQYLRHDGTRAMTGSLNMGTNPVTNAGQYNGVTVEAHAARHNPGGADALAVGVPVATGTANAQGAAASYSRSDHVHDTVVARSIASATAAATSNSQTDVLMTGMTITPAAGTYLAMFSSTVRHNTNQAIVYASIYAGGVQDAASERNCMPKASNNDPTTRTMVLSTQAIVTVNGAQAVEVRWRNSAGPTATVEARSLILIRLG